MAPTGLNGIMVLDLTQGVAGPFCTRLLSQMGARIVKVERPGTGDLIRFWDDIVHGMCSGHAWVNPGKESLALNLKEAAGREILMNLVEKADVIIENFVPGTLESWGLGYEAFKERNQKVIFCRVSGFGQEGVYSDRAALDLIIQGETGLISTNGTPAEPAKISLSVCDISGAMYATVGILEALFHRERTGRGQEVQVALFDAIMTWTGYFPYMLWYGGKAPQRVGLHHHTMAPYGPYMAGDGKQVIVAAGGGHTVMWRKFCEAIDDIALFDDPRFSGNNQRLENRAALDERVGAAFAKQDRAYWLEQFHKYGIPAGALNTLEDALDHQRFQDRQMILEVESAIGPVKVFDFPPRLSDAPSINRLGPPLVGEHTDRILREMGFSDDRIADLAGRGIVGKPAERDDG
ncbi:CaiB/BaiF CoA transferase family protein [Mesorhizobium sp. 1B3]|uniref:CaiB/BaiF CoA transferase family protein n=1 Tax=Mesorhizobium sp. 1B3 TaxID=3243599 RepID=UPI003D98D222